MSRYLLKYALLLGDYRSFRDNNSRKLIESIGVLNENQVFPDLVYSFNVNSAGHVLSSDRQSCIVGINPFPHCDPRYWPVRNIDAYRSYTEKLALFASWLVRNGYKVIYFPTQLRADSQVINDIKRILRENMGVKFEKHPQELPIHDLDTLVTQISMLDLVIATRFHGILLSFLLNKPVLGISNHPKMDNLMADMGQSNYLLNIDDFDLDTFIERFKSLESNRATVKSVIQEKISEYRYALEMQYQSVFSLLKDSSAYTKPHETFVHYAEKSPKTLLNKKGKFH
jgi:polysaccharide pyruvyl transferase WcaK-like protein